MSWLDKIQDHTLHIHIMNRVMGIKKQAFLILSLSLLMLTAHATAQITHTLILKIVFAVKFPQKKGRKSSGPMMGMDFGPVFQKEAIANPIYERNLFDLNKAPIPELEIASTNEGEDIPLEVFESIPCSQGKLPVELLGNVYSSNGSVKVVLMKDPEFEVADLYKEGDPILGYEDYQVFKIAPYQVQFRYGNQKICYDFKRETSSDSTTEGKSVESSGVCERISSQEMARAIGDGYVDILNAVRLIPVVDERGEPGGFKIVAIDPSFLLARFFRVGDVLLQVNDTSLKDPSQGFMFYQVFQSEREVNILADREGVPTMIKICIE